MRSRVACAHAGSPSGAKSRKAKYWSSSGNNPPRMPPLRIVQGSRPAMAWLRWLTRGFSVLVLGNGRASARAQPQLLSDHGRHDVTGSSVRVESNKPDARHRVAECERAARRPLQASARHGASRVGSSLAQTQKCPALPLRRAQFRLCIFSYTRHLRGARVMFPRATEKYRPFGNTFYAPGFISHRCRREMTGRRLRAIMIG